LHFNSQKTQLTNEKLESMLVQLKTTEKNLSETKQAHDKLITIAAKYNIDISRLKDYLKEGPDPLMKDAEN